MIVDGPVVSVVMAVKNGGALVCDAIESILSQTYKDFEFIIINDGSTDNTQHTLESYCDPRIKIFSQENQGLAKSLNRGLKLATGSFVARQDHDDISLPMRLEKQVEYMLANKSCGLLGTAAEIWNASGSTGRYHDHPVSPGNLAFDLIFNNPFVHTSWMIRRSVIDVIGYYTTDPAREPPEDYEFVSRVARFFDVANLPERMVIYREIENSLSSQIRPSQIDVKNTFSAKLALITAENLSHACGQGSLSNDAINFGALNHSFYPGISGKLRLKSMQDMLSMAASKLEGRYSGLNLTLQLEKRQDSLEYQFFLYFEGGSTFKKVCIRIFQKIQRTLKKLKVNG